MRRRREPPDAHPLTAYPYAIDIGNALRTGANLLEIEVVDTWRNRLIGDQPEAKPSTFTTHNPFKADTPLQPSGMLGPVTLIRNSISPLSVLTWPRTSAFLRSRRISPEVIRP